MKLRIPLVAALLAALAVVSGCGGGDSSETTAAPVETAETTALTKAELILQGDAICAEVNAAVGTVSSTGTDTAARVAQEAGLYSGMVERLKGLGAPSDDTGGYQEFIGAAEQLAQAESNAQLAAERGEEAGLETAESEASSALSAFQAAAQSYGFERCGEEPSAPVPGSAGAGEAGGEEAPEVEAEEAAPEEVEEAAPEEGAAGGGAAAGGGGGGTESPGAGGGGSGGIGPG
jgi:hypothetical protein